MRLEVFATLLSVCCVLLFIDPRSISWKKVWPWTISTPIPDYSSHIEFRLVKKDWLPEGVAIPEGQGVLPEYPGTVEEAYKVLRSGSLYEYEARSVKDAGELLTGQYGYDKNLDSIVLIHTISGNADNDFIKNTVIALAMRNIVNHYNVFAVEMPELVKRMRKTVIRMAIGWKTNCKFIGGTVGIFLNEVIKKSLMRADQIHLIGFCYSSQLSGCIARYMKHTNGGQRIKSILALDPYSMVLSSWVNSVLSADDAEAVYALHVNSLGYGSPFRIATVDVVFNNGNIQPGCIAKPKFMCSHRRAVGLLWYMILFKSKFQARACSSYVWFKFCGCQSQDIVTLGYPLDTKLTGRFYLSTEAHHPYGRGMLGADCH